MSANETIQEMIKGDTGSKTSSASPEILQASATEVFVLEAGNDEAPPIQLQKSFTSMAAFGFCFAVLNSWVVLLAGLGAGLSSGGPTALVWGFVYAIICNLALTLSLSEAFSVYPTAGGQYHWAAILAAPPYRALSSWFTALINLGGLWAGVATQAYLASVLIVVMALVNEVDWAPTPGEQYAIYLAVIVFGLGSSLLSGTTFTRRLDSSMTWVSILGLATFAITILSASKSKASAGFVFTGVYNFSGWDSTAIAWLIGLLNSSFAFVGFDLVFHISEEIPDARRKGPRILNATVIVGGITGMFCLLSVLFCINDIEAVLQTSYGLPFAQICMDATGSKAATTIFLLVPALLLCYGSRGCQLTAARLMLSLGRDEGLPWARSWTKIRSGEPIVGLVVSSVIPILAGMVQLGSTAAFNALLGTAVILLQTSYGEFCHVQIIPVILLLSGGRSFLNSAEPDRLWNLGRYGIPCNLVACFFVLQSIVIYCFPATQPVTPTSMNYVSVFVGGYLLILTGLWFGWMRKRFRGPSEIEVRALVERSYQPESTVIRD